jgi:hypothetical protein
MAGCCKLYLSFMILIKNVDFRVLLFGVLDGIAELSALSWIPSV